MCERTFPVRVGLDEGGIELPSDVGIQRALGHEMVNRFVLVFALRAAWRC